MNVATLTGQILKQRGIPSGADWTCGIWKTQSSAIHESSCEIVTAWEFTYHQRAMEDEGAKEKGLFSSWSTMRTVFYI